MMLATGYPFLKQPAGPNWEAQHIRSVNHIYEYMVNNELNGLELEDGSMRKGRASLEARPLWQ